MTAPATRAVPLDAVRWDDRVNVRERLDRDRVAMFAELIRDSIEQATQTGATWQPPLPPIDAVGDGRGGLVGADGRHRFEAHRELGLDSILTAEHPAGGRDPFTVAYELALARAVESALPLSEAEKRAAIIRLASMYPELSDRELGRRVGAHHATVAKWRSANLADSVSKSAGRRPKRSPVEALAHTLAAAGRRFESLGEPAGELEGELLAALDNDTHSIYGLAVLLAGLCIPA